MARVRDLQRDQRSRIVGREAPLRALHALVTDPQAPAVTLLHGVAGIGKSVLLRAFAEQARAQGASVVLLDGRGIEPTPAGFLAELGGALGGALSDVASANSRLAALQRPVIVAIDNYELLRLLDAWIRVEFIPSLDVAVHVILSGREPPTAGWSTGPEWHGLMQTIALGPLTEHDALVVLASLGVEGASARAVNRLAHGHPLALTLAARAARDRGDLSVADAAAVGAIDALVELFLAQVPDDAGREALRAASVVRRVTQPLLGALLPEFAPADLLERIRALPFVETVHDGLVIHDAVREAIAAQLRAAQPEQHRAYRQAAWRALRSGAAAAPPADLWRYTADLLFLIEQPEVREAFFPSGAQALSVERATPRDGPAIHQIAEAHEGPEAQAALAHWWRRLPGAFSAIRDRGGQLAGFSLAFEPSAAPADALAADPVTRAWADHLAREPLPASQRAIFIRRWLAAAEGEGPSAPQAAAWLDAKRSYLEMRPALRRVYIAVRDPEPFADAMTRLGFAPLPACTPMLDGTGYASALLDMGPRSVDGWLDRLLAAEVGEISALLDRDTRELIGDAGRTPLTPKEFSVLAFLEDHADRAVSHAELVSGVWGYDFDGGSNVDAAVVRSLRAKLGSNRDQIRTVRGIGYRLVRPWETAPR